MKIYLRNEIQMDEETEQIVQEFPVEVIEKKGIFYLSYRNDEGEKVVMKADEDEFLMTRFSTPKTRFRFMPNQEAIVTLPTPLGIQQFVTRTHLYRRDIAGQTIALSYELKPLGGDGIFATYQMTLRWE